MLNLQLPIGFKRFLFILCVICLQLFINQRVHATYIDQEMIPLENFERGTFQDTYFNAISGEITKDPLQVIDGKYSAYLQSNQNEVWKGFSYSDPQKVIFEKNTAYSVTFSYKAINAPINGYYYFIARSTDSDVSADKGWTTWKTNSGETGTKTIYFKTDNKKNYYLVWGIFNGGALSLDNIQVKKVSESFEHGQFTGTNFMAISGNITNDPQKVISGQYSAYLESPNLEWSEFSFTNPDLVKLEPFTTYTVTFSYKSISIPDKDKDGYYYFIARSTDNDWYADIGRTNWYPTQEGEMGTKSITFTTGNRENYYLMWGIHKGGAMSLDDIIIQKQSESFERGTYEGTNFSPGSGTVTNDPAQVVSGKYSAFLSSPESQVWSEFSYSNPQKIIFEKNTSYTIEFSYKANSPRNSNSFYYFLVRSTDNDVTNDIGWTAWTAEAGEKGTKKIEFTTGNKDNYYLIWGINSGGAISLDDITLRVNEYQYDANNRLIKQFLPSFSTVFYNYDQNGNQISRKVI